MTQFESAYSEFTKRNTAVVFIAAQKINGLFRGKAHIEQHRYPFPVLFDQTREVTRAYGVHQTIGIDGFNISKPAVFLVGGEGKVEWIAVSPNQFQRPQIAGIIGAIESCEKC